MTEESPLLTHAEETVIRLLGTSAEVFASEILGDGPSRDSDMREFVDKIHVLQQMIMSQAAARAYPKKYRLLGETIDPHEWTFTKEIKK